MAFRILPSGAEECDTIEEFRQLRSQRGHPAAPRAKRQLSKSDSELSENARAFLRALIKSPTGLNTDQASSELKINAKQLPPVLRSLAKWCDQHRHKPDTLIARKPVFVNRRPLTEYRLTEEGLKLFGKLAGAQSMNGKESTMNTG